MTLSEFQHRCNAGEDIHLTKLPANAEIQTETVKAGVLPAAEGVDGTVGSALETPGDGSSSEESQVRPTAAESGEEDTTLDEDTGAWLVFLAKKEIGISHEASDAPVEGFLSISRDWSHL